MVFTSIRQALKAARRFHREYGCRGYRYKATSGYSRHANRFCVAVYARNGAFVTLV